MIKVLFNEKTVVCPHCKSHLLYEKSDVQKKEVSYMAYGCEEKWEEYYYIRCPKCGEEIGVH